MGASLVDLCPQCDGSWYDAGEIAAVLEAPHSVVAASELAAALIDDVERESLPTGPLACPRCGQPLMVRRLFQDNPVEAHVCSHGVWLEDGELSRLLEFVKTCQDSNDSAVRRTLDELRGPPVDRMARDPDLLALVFRTFAHLFKRS